MYRLSLIVTAYYWPDQLRPVPGPSSGTLPRTGPGPPVTACKDKIGAIRAFANSRLTSRARRLLRVPLTIVGLIPISPSRSSGSGTVSQLTRSQEAELGAIPCNASYSSACSPLPCCLLSE